MMMEQKLIAINYKNKIMKNILTISILLLSLVSCKAQITIVPLFSTQDIEESPNYYHKDVNNDLNKFVGTWKYQNGQDEFTVELQKKLMINDNDGSYIYDMIIGEYLYKKNGVIIINTLADINNITISGHSHNISGSSILHKYNNPRCDLCTSLERRTRVIINHPIETEVMGDLTLRHRILNGVEQLEASIINASIMGYNQSSYDQMPWGNFVLIKQ